MHLPIGLLEKISFKLLPPLPRLILGGGGGDCLPFLLLPLREYRSILYPPNLEVKTSTIILILLGQKKGFDLSSYRTNLFKNIPSFSSFDIIKT